MKTLRVLLALALFAALASPAQAVILETSMTGAASATDASSYTTASVSPSKNKLVIVGVLNTKGTTADTPTLSGNGLTWDQVQTNLFDSDLKRVTMFRALSTSTPTPGTITIDFGGATQTGCAWSVYEFSGIDRTGTNGANAIVQNDTQDVTNGGSITATMAAFSSTANGATSICGNDQNGTMTEEAGWSEIHDVATGTAPAFTFHSMWIATNDNTATHDWANNNDGGAIAVELKGGADPTEGNTIYKATLYGATIQ